MAEFKSDVELIDAVGGSAVLATICGEEQNVVSNWRLRNRIPRPWKKFLAEKRPDINWFSDAPEGSEGQPIPPAATVEPVKVAA